MPLDELRTLLLSQRVFDRDTADAMWRQLALHAREWGPAWIVGAVGSPCPGLTHLAAKISRGHRRHAEDIDSEMLTGFPRTRYAHATAGPAPAVAAAVLGGVAGRGRRHQRTGHRRAAR